MRHPTWKLLGLLGITLMTTAPAHAEVRIGLAGAADRHHGVGRCSKESAGPRLAVAELNAAGGVLGEPVRTGLGR